MDKSFTLTLPNLLLPGTQARRPAAAMASALSLASQAFSTEGAPTNVSSEVACQVLDGLTGSVPTAGRSDQGTTAHDHVRRRHCRLVVRHNQTRGCIPCHRGALLYGDFA